MRIRGCSSTGWASVPGRVAFEDRARTRPFGTELRPITFELRDFSTGGESGNAYSLRGASVAGESFAWNGTFQLTPFTSSGKFEVASLQARTIGSYLSDALPFEFSKGVFGLSGEYFYTASEDGGLRFDVHKVSLTDFGMRPTGRDYDYVEIASLALEESKVNVRTRRVDIGRVRLEGGALRVARDAQANINLAELAGHGAEQAAPPAEAAAVAPAPSTPPAAAAPAWVVAAPDIAVTGMRVDVEDALVEPAAVFALTPVNLTVAGYNTAPAARFTVDLTAAGEKTGDLKAHADTDAGFQTFTAHVEASELNLSSLQPYLSTYTQITLKSGWLNTAMDLDSAANGAFKAKGNIQVNKLAAIDNTLKQDLLKWDRLTVSDLDYSSAPARLAIARIDAQAPYARLIIAADQKLNIAELFTPAQRPGARGRADGTPGGRQHAGARRQSRRDAHLHRHHQGVQRSGELLRLLDQA